MIFSKGSRTILSVGPERSYKGFKAWLVESGTGGTNLAESKAKLVLKIHVTYTEQIIQRVSL